VFIPKVFLNWFIGQTFGTKRNGRLRDKMQSQFSFCRNEKNKIDILMLLYGTKAEQPYKSEIA
jgi:hypothetical protein